MAYDQVDKVEHDRLLTNLVFAVRHDLKLRPEDDPGTFSFHMIAPYRNVNSVNQIIGLDRQKRVS